MFANLLHLVVPRTSPHRGHGFVEDVIVKRPERRNPRVMRFLLWCWVLIAIKHVLIIWLCHRYPVPFHQLWVNFPTWLLGVLATALYFARTGRAVR